MMPHDDSTAATIATGLLREARSAPSAPGTFPRALSLAHGVTVNVRLAGPGDEHALLDFYRTLPLEDRLFLKDDVTTDGWATRFMRRIACGEVRSLIAERDGRVVVLEGLQGGEAVVVNPPQRLRDGAAVELQAE